MKKIFILLMLVAGLYSCKKAGKCCEQETTGTIRDFTGKLDGCKMMIILCNGKKLEVRKLPVGTVLIDGKAVAVEYTIVTDGFSFCMYGDIADITSIRYL